MMEGMNRKKGGKKRKGKLIEKEIGRMRNKGKERKEGRKKRKEHRKQIENINQKRKDNGKKPQLSYNNEVLSNKILIS